MLHLISESLVLRSFMALDGLLIIQIVDMFKAQYAACSKDLKHEDRLHSQASNDVIRATAETQLNGN